MKNSKLFLFVTIFVLVACGQDTTKATSDSTDSPIILKLNHVQSSSDPSHAAFERLAELVQEKSDGSIVIEVYGNAELGSNKDNIEQIVRGANIISVGDAGFLGDYLPDYSIMNGPFLYNSYKDLKKLEDSAWHKSLSKELGKQNIKVLTLSWYFGARHLISDKAINTPSDLKGMKVRIPSNIMWKETIAAMGGTPTPIQWSEVYSGLSQGVIDAAEAPLSTLYTSNLHESKKRISLTGHFLGTIGMQMSQKIFDSMTPEQQSIIVSSINEIGQEFSDMSYADEQKWREKLEAEGVIFNEVDTKAFRKSTASVYSAFPEWSENLYKEVLKNLQ